MSIEIPEHDLTYKEEATIQLQRIDGKKLGRGYMTGAKSSVPFGPEVNGGNLNDHIQYAIKTEQERFPDNPEVFSDEFVVGVTIGVWVAMREFEIFAEERRRAGFPIPG